MLLVDSEYEDRLTRGDLNVLPTADLKLIGLEVT